MTRDDTYEQLCDHAYTAETVVINKDLTEDKGLTAVIAGISHHEKQQDKEIENLRNQLEKFTKISDATNQQGNPTQDRTVAVADHYTPRRSLSGDRRPSRQENRVQFRSSTRSRSNSFSDRQGSGTNYTRPRSRSLERFQTNHGFSRGQSPRSHSPRISYDRRDESQTFLPVQSNPPIFTPNPNLNPSNRFSRFTTNSRRPPPYVRPAGNHQPPRFKPNSQRIINCYKCGKRGHIQRECRTRIDRPTFQRRN
jgi:hypothetical protein